MGFNLAITRKIAEIKRSVVVGGKRLQMSQAPKISIPSAVRERLRAARLDLASHPDANLLSAFAENALSAGERAQVMEHVAVCAACREVLAFAMPEEEEAASASRTNALGFRRLALSWNALRWTALAATAAAFVAVVFLYRVQPLREYRMASAPAISRSVPPDLAKSREEKTTQPAAAPSVAEREKLMQPAEKKELPRDQESVTKTLADNFKDHMAAKSRSTTSAELNGTIAKLDDTESQKTAGLDRRQLSQDEKQAQFDKLSSAQGSPVQRQSMAAAPQAGVAAGNPTSLTAPDAAQSYTASNEIRNAPAPSRPDVVGGAAGAASPKPAPASPSASNPFRINAAAANKAKSAPPQESESVEVTAEAPALQTENANTAQNYRSNEVSKLPVKGRMLPSPPPTWRVQRDRVQRSLDGGATWNDVPIANKVAFNAVAAAGDQVWAAASGAVLYHSSDAGATWSVQWSYARDATAQNASRYPAAPARIYKLDISDALNGGFWVKIGGGEPQEFLFTSNDGGKHWYEETVD